VGHAICVRKEHIFATLAPLAEVMGHAGADGSGKAGMPGI
jgi:hypothetical protein